MKLPEALLELRRQLGFPRAGLPTPVKAGIRFSEPLEVWWLPGWLAQVHAERVCSGADRCDGVHDQLLEPDHLGRCLPIGPGANVPGPAPVIMILALDQGRQRLFKARRRECRLI